VKEVEEFPVGQLLVVAWWECACGCPEELLNTPSILYRLESTTTICFVGVTRNPIFMGVPVKTRKRGMDIGDVGGAMERREVCSREFNVES
jgi:hypothetical protein